MGQIEESYMELNTPYYVIHKEELDDNFRRLKEALQKHWDNYIIGYSYKTNALPWVLSHFNHLGCYAEVVSEDEYLLAQKIGVDKAKIIYNGPIKSKESYIEAINNGCIVNIDSQREIEWLDEVEPSKREVGIRVNFDIEKMCVGHSQCPEEGGRFGFCYENGELSRVIAQLNKKNVNISGIHLHVSSKTREVNVYRAIAEMACSISEHYDLKLDYIDIGGGFFGGLSSKPQFEDYLSIVEGILKDYFDKKETKLIIEPGMSVIGAPVSYVTTVIDTKETNYNRFVITDGTRMDIDPLMKKTSYFHRYISEMSNDRSSKQVICGYTCMENDRIYIAENEPLFERGDKIIYDKVGAYTMCLTPLFIKYFPSVYVEENNNLKCVRSAWKPEEFVLKSKIEEYD